MRPFRRMLALVLLAVPALARFVRRT